MFFDSNRLPNYKKLINLEVISKKDGSDINYEELIGIWKFQSVWKKGSDEIDNISSSILQVFKALLELKKPISEKANQNYEIKNSINFGVFSIVFYGYALLKGTRPLLIFHFEKLKINLGNLTLINKKLKKPEENKMPFFSLIAISKERNWMCARGRGGGLAIWIKS